MKRNEYKSINRNCTVCYMHWWSLYLFCFLFYLRFSYSIFTVIFFDYKEYCNLMLNFFYFFSTRSHSQFVYLHFVSTANAMILHNSQFIDSIDLSIDKVLLLSSSSTSFSILFFFRWNEYERRESHVEHIVKYLHLDASSNACTQYVYLHSVLLFQLQAYSANNATQNIKQ